MMILLVLFYISYWHQLSHAGSNKTAEYFTSFTSQCLLENSVHKFCLVNPLSCLIAQPFSTRGPPPCHSTPACRSPPGCWLTGPGTWSQGWELDLSLFALRSSLFALSLKIALLKERPWAIHSPRSLKKRDCERITLVALYKRVTRANRSLTKSDQVIC